MMRQLQLFAPGRFLVRAVSRYYAALHTILLLGTFLFGCPVKASDVDLCSVCGNPITSSFYRIEDKVTLEKRNVCKDCGTSLPTCFVCGLPSNTKAAGFRQLSDGRTLCARDAETAILQSDDGVRACRDTWEGIDRLFSRFISFPDKNVRIQIVDRVHLLDLFKLPGNDIECPNVWGFTQSRPVGRPTEHQISILGGMPLSFFRAACAHEYTHTWLNETLSDSRKRTLSKDAAEGFCELVSYLYMDSLRDEGSKARILNNAYTRGQIDLFIAAERRFGFNDVIEWMKSGADDRLDQNEPNRIRNVVNQPPNATPAPVAYYQAPTPAPDRLALKAVFWDATKPTALINDRTFAVNEQGKVHLGATNVLVHCLAIRKDAVVVRIDGSNVEQNLRLGSR
ncbi:MAG TPA: protein DA1 [Verrucomicrobiae bacterium]|nr:protein DA1 [Verrucomicrobiae bacterium]